MDHATWTHELITAREARHAGAEAGLYRAVDAGRLTRLATGVYLPSATWRDLGPDERFVARVRAVALRHPDHAPFCGLTAAALWRLPAVIPWPPVVEVAAGDQNGGRSRADIRRRSGREVDEVAIVDGLRVTGLARTLSDVARWSPATVAVPMIDAALAGRAGGEVDREALEAEWMRGAGDRGAVRAGRALAAADAGSGSPGESLSRVVIAALGFPPPVLQRRFDDADGLIGFVDFWWPEHRLIGEFDGVAKYVREEFADGRSSGEIVVAEKRREDRLRATGPRMARWGWAEARSPRLLERALRGAGLPQRSPAARNRRVIF
jgi:hypothetical protein